jgi:hypothetical protein
MKPATVRFAQGDRFADGVFLPSDLRGRTIKRLVDRERALRSHRGFGYQRRKNEFLPGYNTQRDNWYYDTVSFAAGAAFTTTLMFQQQQTGTKLLNSTNLTGQGGQLPAGSTMMVNCIRVSISNLTNPADFANIFANVSFEFIVNNVPIYQCTPDFLPAGYGAPTFSIAQVGTAPTGTSVVSSTNNGMPVQTAIYEFKYPYQLSSLEAFVVKLTPQVAFNMVAASGVNPIGTGTTIRVYIDGIRQGLVTS